MANNFNTGGSGLMAQNMARLAAMSPAPSVSAVPAPVPTAPETTASAITQGNIVNTQLPNYAGDIKGVGANVASEIGGQLPASVIQQLQQQGAERGISTGSPGSPNANASYMQALGLNSLQLTNTGQQNLNTQTAALPGAAISQNPNFYVSPSLVQQGASQNASMQTDANANYAALQAAQAGLASGGGGGGTSIASPPNLGANPPTNTQSTNPFYAPPSVGWDTGNGTGTPNGASTLETISGILNDYAGTVDPNSAPASGTNDATGQAFNPQPDEAGEFAYFDG